MKHFADQEHRLDSLYPSRFAIDVDQFPTPRVQKNPAVDLARMKAEEQRRVAAYGWVDRKAGIAHIPVERAMDILAQTGLPKVAAPAPVAGVPPRTFIPPGTKREEPKPRPVSLNRSRAGNHESRTILHSGDRCSSLPSWRAARLRPGAGDRGQRGEPGGLRSEAGRAAPARPPLPRRVGPRADSGRPFGRRPVILAPVYYRCPMLCNQVLNGLTRSLKPLSLDAGKDFDIVAVSINPDEKPELAAMKKLSYLERYDRPGSESGWHFLTGEEASIEALTRAIGFRYTYNPRTKLYAHAAGVVVVTPDGRVARYFYGIDFPAKELQAELERARQGRVGAPIGRLLLLCYDYDAATGKYTLSILG